MTERGAIEIAPLAGMRGRTLNDVFIVLDEAQNTTSEHKMFDRPGSTRAWITGTSPVDRPTRAWLIEIQSVLKPWRGSGLLHREGRRARRLVPEIVRAYDSGLADET
jgi:phosphate starvation-inducible PhoH-like protein